jgi:hypothetical protein
MDVTDIVLAAVTGGVVLICCIGTLLTSACYIRKYVILRQTQLQVNRQRLSTEDDLIL